MRKSAYLILLALGSVHASMSILYAADASPSASVSPMTDNPLFSESSLPYHSPPFDKIKDEHYPPAFERAWPIN
jgi:peptidyl-dipeptidase Dcp